jgi:hypothetical protein
MLFLQILRIPTPTHFRIRALEWGLSAMLVSCGAILFDQYDTLDAPIFSQLRAYGDDTFWGTVFLIVGLLRLLALYVNGSWMPSPWVRMITAMASAIIWGLITLGLFIQNNAYLLLAVFPWFILADIYSVGRAASDARLSRDERMNKPEAPKVMTFFR